MSHASDPSLTGLQAYIVGGSVRDALLGLPAGDRDWVVVGATPEDMAKRGFVPVGGDFPVFLHPRSKEEYALARTERKSGRGYKGFTFHTGADVTLEDDLRRRDLTINAIARLPDGRLVDPLGGQDDIRHRVLRHVGAAFTEDPVRLLRLARFAARFPDFAVAAETMALARQLVDDGEVDALVPERVWQEMAKGLMTSQPGRMFAVLQESGALPRVLPGLVFTPEVSDDLARAAAADVALAYRFGLLCRLSGNPAAIGQHVRAPSECQDAARLMPEVVVALIAENAGTQSSAEARVQQWLQVMERCDALRKPQRFLDLIAAASCVFGTDDSDWEPRVHAIRGVDAGAIAKRCAGDPSRIRDALRDARLAALRELL